MVAAGADGGELDACAFATAGVSGKLSNSCSSDSLKLGPSGSSKEWWIFSARQGTHLAEKGSARPGTHLAEKKEIKIHTFQPQAIKHHVKINTF